MITVDTPTGFEWNEINSQWVKNYLTRKTTLLQKLTGGIGIDINNLNQFQFQQLCQLLETTAEGRELRNQLFKAWRSKKSRDSDNGKKLYTFNLSIKAGNQLKRLAHDNPLNQTLEKLIFAGQLGNNPPAKEVQLNIAQLTLENKQLREKITNFSVVKNSEEDEIEALLDKDLHVQELAKLEKSQLIKQILLLKRKINQSR